MMIWIFVQIVLAADLESLSAIRDFTNGGECAERLGVSSGILILSGGDDDGRG